MSFDDSVLMANHASCLRADCPKLWVFGYGSLLWKPDFEFTSKEIGYIENFERKFNQGNETFRGTRDKPGRVANLEQKEGCKVWGVAYEITGRDEVIAVLRNLYKREIACGGYEVMTTTFFPRNLSRRHRLSKRSQSALFFSLSMPTGSNTEDEPSSSSQTDLSDSRPNGAVNGKSDSPSQLQSHKSQMALISEDPGESSNSSDSNDSDSKDDITTLEAKFSFQTLYDTDNGIETGDTSSADDVVAALPTSPFIGDKLSKGKQQHNQRHLQNGHIPNLAKKRQSLQLNDIKTQLLKDTNTTALSNCKDVLVFTATQESDQYLGTDRASEMAKQIVDAEGTAGSNVEYVLRISEFIKETIPEDNDFFLFNLESKIKQELHRK